MFLITGHGRSGTWIEDNHKIEKIYKIEDLEKVLPIIFKANKIETPLPGMVLAMEKIPKNTHTGGRENALTWEDLEKEDKGLSMKIKEYSMKRGYQWDH